MDGSLKNFNSDTAFKEMIADKEVRARFLSAVLKISSEDIKETCILNIKLHECGYDRYGILYVRILLNDGTETDIRIRISQLDV